MLIIRAMTFLLLMWPRSRTYDAATLLTDGRKDGPLTVAILQLFALHDHAVKIFARVVFSWSAVQFWRRHETVGGRKAELQRNCEAM